MAAQKFTFLIRTQFKIRTEAGKLNSVLKAIAAAKINVNAYNIRQRENRPRALLVVGLPDSTENDAKWNKEVKKILHHYKVCYTDKEVVQVLGVAAGVTGVISGIYDALYREVQIYNIYLAEATRRIVDSNNNKKVIEILSQL